MEIKHIEIKDCESPDFIVTMSERVRIGVELTGYYSNQKGENGKPLIQIEREVERRLLKKGFEEAKKYPELKGIYIYIEFSEKRLPKKEDYQVIIKKIIDLVLSSQVVESLEEKEIVFGEYNIDNIYVTKISDKTTYRYPWDSNISCGAYGVSEEELVRIVPEKVKKSKCYREKNVQELWLLIVSGDCLSQAIQQPCLLQQEINSFIVLKDLLESSDFNKVFIYCREFEAVIEWPNWILIKH